MFIMKRLQKNNPESSGRFLSKPCNLSLESTLQELSLFNFQVESSRLGKEVARTFEANPLLPGVILVAQGQFLGMISRWRFFEQLSRPYGIQLFLKRPIKSLYRLAGTKSLILSSDTPIVEAVKAALQRSVKLVHEPIVVKTAPGVYRLADMHQLLIAQSQIHELTTQILNEQTQAHIRQTEKMATLGRIIAGVAHEIRNPLNCVCGNLDFLSDHCKNLLYLLLAYEEEVLQPSQRIKAIKEEIELDFLIGDLQKIVKTMKLGGERLTKLVSGLRNFSHMDEVNRQFIDIHECIDSTLLILSNPLKEGIEVIKNYGDLPPVSCYYSQMSQVFMNIISNAIDALMEKVVKLKASSNTWHPRIEITTKLCTPPANLSNSSSPWVSVRIADNGFGIPQDVQGRIFERFFTTKPVGKGTGLGLAISYQIVTEKHGGQLLCASRTAQTVPESQFGEGEPQFDTGTEFELLLPVMLSAVEADIER